LITVSLGEFKTGLSQEMEISPTFSIAETVRAFEHSIGLSDKTDVFDPVSDYLQGMSKPIWMFYNVEKFPTIGINYDAILQFKGEVLILGSAFNLIVNPSVVDVLSEFFSDSTLILFRDGHSLEKTKSQKEFSNLLLAFLKNDFEMKVQAYQKLTGMNLIFQKRNYNSIPIY